MAVLCGRHFPVIESAKRKEDRSCFLPGASAGSCAVRDRSAVLIAVVCLMAANEMAASRERAGPHHRAGHKPGGEDPPARPCDHGLAGGFRKDGLTGAADTEGKGKKRIRYGTGRLILVAAVVIRIAVVMVVDMLFDRPRHRSGAAATMPRTAMPAVSSVPRSIAPNRGFAEITAMVRVPLVDIVAGTMIAAGPGTSREDEHKSDQRQTDECNLVFHDFLLGVAAGYPAARV